MLHRSFKPAKCKTSLKLATSRIKLMKNKKGVQMNQMKKELAQLIESGQDRTARIRVEHVIREEKMVAAYDLIEIYCELIAARLPVIESQKNCPIDLKEAITSVVFASPRCADIPELLDIRKHFTAKYGKEFISAAIELRPDCGVSRMLIEKLSAVAPDVQTKIKVLSAVAAEHNIKWDPNSFEEKESKPPEDLLNGPNTFEKASEMHADLPKSQTPNVQAVHVHEQNSDESLKFSQQSRRSSLGTQNSAFMDTGSNEMSSAASHTDTRPSGRMSERMEFRQSFPRDGNDFSSDRQNWNMEFKDATSAAQAAAESAERASIAARAAAQLSSRGKITRQSSIESEKSNIREARPQNYAASEFPSERHSRNSSNSSFTNRKHREQNQRIDRSEHDTLEKAADRFYGNIHGDGSASLRSSKDAFDGDKLVKGFPKADGYSQHEEKGSKAERSSFTPEINMKKESIESKVDLVNDQKDGYTTENINYFGNVIGKQSSSSSPRSQSSTFSDEFNVSTSDHGKFGNNAVPDRFVGIDQRNSYGESTHTRSYVDDAAVNDETDSDDDGPRFDMGPKYDEGEAKSFFPSPDRESPTHLSENANIRSPRKNTSKAVEKSSSQTHFYSERHSLSGVSDYAAKAVESSMSDNHVPVAFDSSGRPDSEREAEVEKSMLDGTKHFTLFPSEQDLYSKNPEPTKFENHDLRGSSFLEKDKAGSDTSTQQSSSFDDSSYTKMKPKYDSGTESDVESPKKYNPGKSRIELTDLLEKSESSFYNPKDEVESLQSQRSSRLSFRYESKDNVRAPQSPDTLEDGDQSGSESEKELNFGTLTGGLRNRGYKHPPFSRIPAGDASSSPNKSVEESSTTIEKTPAYSRSSLSSKVSRVENEKSSVPDATSNSKSDDSREKYPNKFSQKAGKEVNAKSLFEPPVSFLNHDADDSEEDVLEQTTTSRVRLGTGISRRTKVSPPSSDSQFRVSEPKTVNITSGRNRKSYRNLYKDETPTDPQSEPMSKPTISRREESLKSQAAEQPFISRRQPVEPSRRSYNNETSGEPRAYPGNLKQEAYRPLPESKITMHKAGLKSQSEEQTSTPPKKTVESGGMEDAENPVKKPSHVHPKLPDYDSLAARLDAIRNNRQ